MNRSETVAESMVDRLFAGRKGHGGGPCSRRVMWPGELRAVIKVAYELGWKDGAGAAKAGPGTETEAGHGV